MTEHDIAVSIEAPRGYGYRTADSDGVGVYLCGVLAEHHCGHIELPVALTTCPCCSAGIRATARWTWIRPHLLMPKRAPQTAHATGYD